MASPVNVITRPGRSIFDEEKHGKTMKMHEKLSSVAFFSGCAPASAVPGLFRLSVGGAASGSGT